MRLWGISPSAGSGAGAATTPRDNVSTKTNLMETFILRAEGGGSENGCPSVTYIPFGMGIQYSLPGARREGCGGRTVFPCVSKVLQSVSLMR